MLGSEKQRFDSKLHVMKCALDWTVWIPDSSGGGGFEVKKFGSDWCAAMDIAFYLAADRTLLSKR
jgi:hypothetical protein